MNSNSKFRERKQDISEKQNDVDLSLINST